MSDQHPGHVLEIERTFDAPAEEVFEAWTSGEVLRRWFHGDPEWETPTAEVDLRVGGRYRIDMRAPDGTLHRVTGTYREVDPPNRLVYTWQWETTPGATETLVTVEFHDRAGRTEVVLTHERLPDAEARARHEHGWNGCFEKLATLFAERM